MADESAIDLPDDWREAISRAVSGGGRRFAVLGPVDVGKSSFIRAFAAKWNREEPLGVLDLDPGQKMIGPPGTVALGYAERTGEIVCRRFVFVGSTSSVVMRAIWAAAGRLREAEPFIANTSGFVLGPGVPLQAGTVAALGAELVFAIGLDAPPLPKGWQGELVRLRPSPAARRKSAPARAASRQAAFDRHVATAPLRLDRAQIWFEPGPPRAFPGDERPICCLADEGGEDMALAVLETADERSLSLTGAVPPRPVRFVRLGRIWALPGERGWQLLEKLEPAWEPSL